MLGIIALAAAVHTVVDGAVLTAPGEGRLPPIEARVPALLAKMTLDAKVAQTLQLSNPVGPDGKPLQLGNESRFAWLQRAFPHGVGSMSEGFWGGFCPHTNPPTVPPCPPGAGWWMGAEPYNAVQKWFIQNTTYGIPVSVWTETLHSAQGGGAVFPAPAGLGATWNDPLVRRTGEMIGHEARARGVHFGFSPELQVDTDPRFGRTAEAFFEDPTLVSQLGVAYAIGLQGGATGGPDTHVNLSSLLTEAKHLGGYGQSGKDAYFTDIANGTLFDVSCGHGGTLSSVLAGAGLWSRIKR